MFCWTRFVCEQAYGTRIFLRTTGKCLTISEIDLIPAFATFLCSLLIRLEVGIVVGIAINVIILLYTLARPSVHVEKQQVSKHYKLSKVIISYLRLKLLRIRYTFFIIIWYLMIRKFWNYSIIRELYFQILRFLIPFKEKSPVQFKEKQVPISFFSKDNHTFFR